MTAVPRSLRRAARILVLHEPDAAEAVLAGWLVDTLAAHGVLATARRIGRAGEPITGSLVEVSASAAERSDVTGVLPETVDVLVGTDIGYVARAVAHTSIADPERTSILSGANRAITVAEQRTDSRWWIDDDELHAYLDAHSWRYGTVPVGDVLEWAGLPAIFASAVIFGAVCAGGLVDVDPAVARAVVAGTYRDPATADAARRAFDDGARQANRGNPLDAPLPTASQLVREHAHDLRPGDRSELRRMLAAIDDGFREPDAGHIRRAAATVAGSSGMEAAQRLVGLCRQVAAMTSTVPSDAARELMRTVTGALAEILVPRDRVELARRMLAIHEHAGLTQRSLRSNGVDERRTYRVPADLLADANETAADRAAQLPPVELLDLDRPRDARRLAVYAREIDSPARRAAVERLERIAGEYVEAVIDAIPLGFSVARTVAASGRLVGGWGTARNASEITARTFWGRVVRQAIAVDTARNMRGALAAELIDGCWHAMAVRGAVALWDLAGEVVALGMRASRGATDDELFSLRARMLERAA